MADVSMKDFLLQYYMQLRFNAMPAEVRAQYDVYVAGDDFRGNMEEWKSKLMHDNGHGKYVQNDLPDPNDIASNYHLTNSEWEKLFKAYQKALRGMAAARADDPESINKDASDFIDEYFGDPATHLFSSAQADPNYANHLEEIRNIFNSHPQIEYVLRQGGYTDISFSDLKTGMASKKYNTDPNFQAQLIKIIGFLSYKSSEDATIAGWFNVNVNGAPLNLQDVADNAFADNTVDPNKLDNFKRNHQTMLNVLYKKDKIFDVFKNHDGGKISGRISVARGKLKYDDKNDDDYVPPKRDDELTPIQQLSKFVDDTYDNVLDKYLKFHGDRLYFSKNAENIVKAINGAKIKPTDGIKGVLDKADDIKKNLLYKSPTATKHFDWFVKTLGEMKDTMKKAFAGALQNGRQMRALVSEIIMKAVRDNKMDEAKTTLEVLSVIKYGAVTSKTMEAMAKSDITIFSDGKLSWNKNQGVQFVSNALDKSIKAAFMGIGYGITIIGNEIRLSNSKFNGNLGRIKNAQEQWSTQNDHDRQALQHENNIRNSADRAEITNQQTIQNRITRQRTNPITDANYNNLKSANDQTQQRLSTQATSQRFRTAQASVAHYDELNTNISNLQNKEASLQNDEITLQARIQQLSQMLSNQNTYNNTPAPAQSALASQILAQIQDAQQELTEVQSKLHDTQQNLATENQNLNNHLSTNNITSQQQEITRYNNAKQRADAMQANLQQWHDAHERIAELNNQINKRDNELANWDNDHTDKYKELMAYWDMLETGRDSHMGAMYNWLPRGKKSAQKAFNQHKGTLISDYLSGYSYAA